MVAVVGAGPLRGVIDVLEGVGGLKGGGEGAGNEGGGYAGLEEAEGDGEASHAGAAGS